MLTKKNIINCIVLIMIAITVLPVLWVCFYSVPSVDDWEIICYYKQRSVNGFFFPFKMVYYYYTTWQGTYFSDFMLSIPIYNLLGLTGYRIWMFFVTLLFFATFTIAFRAVLFRVSGKAYAKYFPILLLLSLVYILGYNPLNELFYWYNASNVYTVPLICAFLSIFCFAISSEKKFVICASIFGFLAAGGALNISMFICAAITALAFLMFNEAGFKRRIIATGIIYLGAIINIAAPGNFRRKGVISADVSIKRALLNTVTRIHAVLSRQLRVGLLLAIVIIIFAIAYKTYETQEKKYRYPLLFSAYCYLSLIAIDAPVIYGYGVGEAMSDRCVFVECISVLFFAGLLAFYWGRWAAECGAFKFTREHLALGVFVCAIVLLPFMDFHSLAELVPYKMIVHMVGSNNDLKTSSLRQVDLIKQLENSREEDVIVYCEPIPEGEWSNTRNLGLSEDAEHWVNVDIARYYGKKSVRIVYE